MRQTRFPIVPEVIFPDVPLTLGKPNTIRGTQFFPTGLGGWYTLWLIFKFDLVVGTGTGAISEGILKIIQSLMFNTDRDGETHDSPARGLYRYAHSMLNVAPIKEEIAAATGSYRVAVPLLFHNRNMIRPADTLLDTERYRALQLDVTLGTVADVLTTPGTATLACSLTAVVDRTFDALPPQLTPRALPYFKVLPSVNPQTQDYIDLDRIKGFRLHELVMMTANSVTLTVPFSGTPADNVLNTIGLVDGHGDVIKKMTRYLYQQQLKEHIVDTLPTGVFKMSFLKDGSYNSGIDTDPNSMSKLRVEFTNDTPSTSGVTVLQCGARDFKEALGGA